MSDEPIVIAGLPCRRDVNADAALKFWLNACSSVTINRAPVAPMWPSAAPPLFSLSRGCQDRAAPPSPTKGFADLEQVDAAARPADLSSSRIAGSARW
jgi:hypothetical protein